MEMIKKNFTCFKTNFHLSKNKTTTAIMTNPAYIIAIILTIIWAITYLGYGVGGVVHLLLVIAFIAIMLRNDPKKLN